MDAEFGRYLRSVREVTKASTYRVAYVSGVSQSQLSKLERGRNAPSRDTVLRMSIAGAYGCPWLTADENAQLLLGLARYWIPSAWSEYGEVPVAGRGDTKHIMELAAGSGLIIHAIRHGWSNPTVRTLLELWDALGIPRRASLSESDEAIQLGVSRALWVWALWRVDQKELRTDVILQVGGELAKVAVAELLKVARARLEDLTQNPAPNPGLMVTEPADPDWVAVHGAWQSLSPHHRQLIRELVEALVDRAD